MWLVVVFLVIVTIFYGKRYIFVDGCFFKVGDSRKELIDSLGQPEEIRYIYSRVEDSNRSNSDEYVVDMNTGIRELRRVEYELFVYKLGSSKETIFMVSDNTIQGFLKSQ